MFRFIFSKRFLLHFVLAAIFIVGCASAAYFYLMSYTEADSVVQVPDLTSYDLFEAETLLKDADLEAEVIDSLYLPEMRGGEVVDQQPPADSKVKKGRKIYLTIARYRAPMVKMPNIIDQTLPLALAKLSSYGLNVGEITYKPSECTDCVIDAMINSKSVSSGKTINKGAKIDLVVGGGKSGESVFVPMLYGLNVEEAQQLLNLSGLNVGATPYIDCENMDDSLAARIYRQNPEPGADQKIPAGSSIDLFLSSDASKIPPTNLDSLKSLLK